MADNVTILVNPARAADLERVRALIEAARLPTDGLEDQFPRGYVVAVRKGEMVGTAGVETHGGDGLLRSVVVDAGCRGSGLGHTLTFNRIQWAKSHGLASLWLLTTTAAPFFARIGFAVTERSAASPELQASREFGDACPANATCMRLDLGALPTGPALWEHLGRRAAQPGR